MITALKSRIFKRQAGRYHTLGLCSAACRRGTQPTCKVALVIRTAATARHLQGSAPSVSGISLRNSQLGECAKGCNSPAYQ